MKLIGYLRVSGQGQVEGDGFERQRSAIAEFCEVEDFVREEGVSGTVEGVERPALLELFERGPDGIVVERMDRLARDLMVQELILKECRERGIQVFAADQGQMTDVASNEGDPTRVLIRQLMGALAQWEKSTIVKKLRAARQRAKEKNGRCEGRKPYGHSECEQSVLEIMIERYAEHGIYQDVVEYLNDLGMTTRTGTPWNRGTVSVILKRYPDRIEAAKKKLIAYGAKIEFPDGPEPLLRHKPDGRKSRRRRKYPKKPAPPEPWKPGWLKVEQMVCHPPASEKK